MRLVKFFVFLLLLPAFTSISLAADKKAAAKKDEGKTTVAPVFRCGADVFYSWQPSPPPAPSTQVKSAASSSSSTSAPIEEFYQRVFDLESSEQEAKERFTKKVPTYEAQARRRCEEKHQSMSLCLATNLKRIQDEMQTLNFEERRILRDSVTQDCQQSYGRCVATRTGEISCAQDKVAEGPTPSADDKSKGKKK